MTGRIRRPRRDDHGSVAVLVCFVVLTCALLTGFVVELGTRLTVASRADTYSAEAARAASIALGVAPSPQAVLRAAAAARSYLDAAGATGTVAVDGTTVEVSATVTETTPLLGVAVSATRTHAARLEVGRTLPEGGG
jgi:Flp pilus assembly protein TadG